MILIVATVIFQSLASPDRVFTTETALNTAARLSTALQSQLAFAKGAVLALCTPNVIDIAIINLAVWHAGGVITPLNPASTSNEISRQLKDSGASIIVSHPICLGAVHSAASDAGIQNNTILLCGEPSPSTPSTASHPIKHWHTILAPPHAPVLPAVPISSPKTTTALLPYSSGTTGLPKGVILTHHNLTSNILQSASRSAGYFTWSGGPAHTIAAIPPAPPYNPNAQTGGDVSLAVLPLYHIYGLHAHMLLPLHQGTKCVVDDTGLRWDPARYAEHVHRFGVTMGYIVPPMALGLLKASSEPSSAIRRRLSGVRILLSAAAPLATQTIECLWDQLGLRTVQAFGMSETSPALAQLSWDEWWVGRGSVGRALPGVEVKILKIKSPRSGSGEAEDEDDDGGEEAAPGEEGELVVRGPNVFSGYLHHPPSSSSSAAASPSSAVNAPPPPPSSYPWFRTGDLALSSSSSSSSSPHHPAAPPFYRITGRLKELIKYQGYPVAPAELEAHLLAHPTLVDDAAVIGVWDPVLQTEVPRAYVVRKGGGLGKKVRAGEGDAEEVAAWVAGRVSNYKRLRGGVRWVEAVPRSAAGKILRRVLGAMAVAEAQAEAEAAGGKKGGKKGGKEGVKARL